MATLIDRRTFLCAGAAGIVLGAARIRPAHASAARLYLSARTTFDGAHGFAGFTADGTQAFEVPLPSRGHSCAVRPDGAEVVAFARRPGAFMAVIDPRNGRLLRTIEAAPHRHFFGHGVFSPDGGRLYATENAFDGEGRGVLGVYDVRDGYRRIGEVATGGIGPHDLRLLSDGRTLVVANGGILTHPDTGRAKLNIPTMDPSLVYLDRDTGTISETVRLPADLHKNSIRHLAVTADDQVVAALQYQGPRHHTPPLVFLHRRGNQPVLLDTPADVRKRMRNYCGSACVDTTGRMAAVSAPRGGLVTLWSLPDGAYAGAVEVADGCGVAPDGTPGGFIITSGAGGVVRHDRGGTTTVGGAFLANRRWDNHLMVTRFP